ncbi:MAG: hypothetical protein V4475_16575 [Pseudomonadota bacterium]
MQIAHIPKVNARYWSAILFASLCGTNSGDLYAHEAHLGIVLGTAILAVLAAAVFLLERRDSTPRELYYWTVIIIIRTGATNIADFMKHSMPWVLVGGILTAFYAAFVWLSKRGDARREAESEARGMPSTGAAYWTAMLGAGIFGTFFGDMCAKLIGKGAASLALGALLLVALAIWRRDGVHRFWLYWIALAVARTAGTAMGDWLAETRELGIGLPLSTLITATIFVLILTLWPRQGGAATPISQAA